MRAETSSGCRPEPATRPGRRLTVLLTGLFIGLFGAAMLAPATASAEGETYTVATDTTFAPFEFQDAGGNFVGIDMDLIRAIGRLSRVS